MKDNNEINIINDLIKRAESLVYRDETALNGLKQDAKMIIRRVFGTDSDYLRSVDSANFFAMFSPSDESTRRRIWNKGQHSLINTFSTMKRELELFQTTPGNEEDEETYITDDELTKVFLVHGHDEAMKQTVARSIQNLGLEPIILSEQDDEGMTVIEKFEKYASECKYAVVLLSPDDMGYSKLQEDDKNFRARQNVILELGYFIGVLGRKSVLTLVKDDSSGQLELPSDIAGVIYTPYDVAGGWKLKLVRGLKSVGYNVSADDL